ncbi:MAG: 4Fe-4S binding protein [Sedimentibacter sp.]
MILDFFIHKLTEENLPEINKDKCINCFDKKLECNLCQEVCPENAIQFKNKNVVFNEKLCTKCGVCKAKCPTQAIKLKGIGEDNIFNQVGEKKNLVFSCSIEGGEGNLNISCLNALHPEFISALFILYQNKKFYFNLSKCAKCKVGYTDSFFRDALNKAVDFTKALGIETDYEIYTEEKELFNLLNEGISRRDLFRLVKIESGNVVLKTINTVIDVEDTQLPIRKTLLESMDNIVLEAAKNSNDTFWEYWDVNSECDGCGKCVEACPGKAWNIQKTDTKIKLYHNPENCYKCGLCERACTKKAITKKSKEHVNSLEFKLKREINLYTCKICNKKFVSNSQDNEVCDICRKKELLRKNLLASFD